MKISILKDSLCNFDNEQYVVDLSRRTDDYVVGDLICFTHPFGPQLPLQLEIAIRPDGQLSFRQWHFTSKEVINAYLHTREISQEDCSRKHLDSVLYEPFIPTSAQIDTVNGLFSGRIRFEGLKLAPGVSLQKICPIDVEREEKMTKKRIYLA